MNGWPIDADKLEAKLRAAIPHGHREFAARLLADHGVPELPEGERARELLGWTAATAGPQVETILKHEKARLVANALGTPPADVVRQIQDSGRIVGALCGSVRHALAHKEAGIDFLIAQGTEGGGHTGEVGSMVLWPEVIDAVAPLPVLAAPPFAWQLEQQDAEEDAAIQKQHPDWETHFKRDHELAGAKTRDEKDVDTLITDFKKVCEVCHGTSRRAQGAGRRAQGAGRVCTPEHTAHCTCVD